LQSLISNLWVLGWSLFFTAALWGGAYSFEFFQPIPNRKPRIGFKEAVLAFALFLSFQLFFLPFLITGVALSLGQSALSLQTRAWMNLGSVVILGVLLLAYTSSLKVRWFSREGALKNIGLGVSAWFLAFPLIVAITQFLTIIFYNWLGFQLEDQMAVKQVKSVQEYPWLFATNLFAIVMVVPLIEEVLFRGFLQESLLKKMSVFKSICLTALLFSLFHFSISQGINNILILTSLFLLGWLLGYLKEKQMSLLPCVALHATFNAISLVQIFVIQ
jgi:membrane protease YdiL (CAAX protease family)